MAYREKKQLSPYAYYIKQTSQRLKQERQPASWTVIAEMWKNRTWAEKIADNNAYQAYLRGEVRPDAAQVAAPVAQAAAPHTDHQATPPPQKRQKVDHPDAGHYDADWFVDDTILDQWHLRCSVCLDAVCNAVSPTCGHCICKTCYKPDTIKRCPLCNNTTPFNPNGYADLVVMDLDTQCTFCNAWTGKLRDLLKHHKTCAELKVPCTQCNTNVKCADMEAHMKTECPERNVKCELCATMYKFSQRGSHDKICDAVPMTCEDCKAIRIRRHFLDHMCTCTSCNTPVILSGMGVHKSSRCTCGIFCPYGCNKFINKVDLKSHMATHPLRCPYGCTLPPLPAPTVDDMLVHMAVCINQHKMPSWNIVAQVARGSLTIDELERYLSLNPTAVHLKDNNGETALHWAAYNNHVNFAKVLVERGSFLFEKNDRECTPSGEAKKHNAKDTTEFLQSLGAK